MYQTQQHQPSRDSKTLLVQSTLLSHRCHVKQFWLDPAANVLDPFRFVMSDNQSTTHLHGSEVNEYGFAAGDEEAVLGFALEHLVGHVT